MGDPHEVELLPLWSVTLTVAGERTDLGGLRSALDALVRERPLLSRVRYAADRVELHYWDEAEDADDAAALALRLWPEHRRSTGLPDWRVAGVEVVDRATVEHRLARAARDAAPRPGGRPRWRHGGRPLDVVGDVAPW
ncbi:hypothetical protein ACFFKU_08710 [Kineococcus gynurae]|uniref:Uncharacterized protein n=1 Tax=Kineococcus gynurae TaxID=452979 RepID=A0ABV5LVY8_9ACTN